MCAVLGSGDTAIHNPGLFSLENILSRSHILMGERNKLTKLINERKMMKTIGAMKNIIQQSSIKAKVTTLATFTLNLNDKKEQAVGTQHSRQRNS